jgi:ribose transport system substrate-binding protein
MRKVLVFFLMVGIAAFGFAGAKKDVPGKYRTFGLTVPDMTNSGYVAMRDSIKKVLDTHGDRLLVVDAAIDQIKQNSGIEDMITQGIEVLFLVPVNFDSVQPALIACHDAGVKIVVLDNAVSRADLTETLISSNNFQAGELCGQEIMRLFPNGANICVLEYPVSEAATSRLAGLESVIKGSKSVIVGRKAVVTGYDEVLPFTEDMLQAHPDVNAFWALNDPVGLIMVGVLESAGLSDKVKVVAVDGSPAGKQSIAANGLQATIAQSVLRMGSTAAELAYKILAGEKIEKNYSIDTILINRDNINQFDINGWQ